MTPILGNAPDGRAFSAWLQNEDALTRLNRTNCQTIVCLRIPNP